MEDKNRNINIVMVGHVDHGKSTVLGRLLADSGSLPKGKMEQLKALCKKNSKPFEYAFLLDALKDEQKQGITIDAARVFFKKGEKRYLFIDAPGHIEFLKNMVTGASHAEGAFLVIDAKEGVRENSKRHAFLLSVLGVKQVTVVVNKMDLVLYDENRFNDIVEEYTRFLEEIDLSPLSFIPASGIEGDNIVKLSKKMSWYKGKTVLDAIDMFRAEMKLVNKPLRMPVQDVYKFTKSGDDRRIIAGTISTGKIMVGDEVIFYPSGKKSTIKTIEAFNSDRDNEAVAGQATGFTLDEQIYVKRGDVAIKLEEPKPQVTSRIKTSVFWLGKEPMTPGKVYIFKMGTSKSEVILEKIEKNFDPTGLNNDLEDEEIKHNKFAECILKLKKPIAFDLVSDFQETSRFVIIDNYHISGGGIILDGLEDKQSWIRDKVLVRNYKWEKSMIPNNMRTKRFKQKSSLVVISGKKDVGKKRIAKALEEKLFSEGKLVYFLGIGNVLYGVDADIKGINDTREEHIRRLSEIANIMLEAGMILVVTAIELTADDLELVKAAVNPDRIEVIWIGKEVTTDIEYDLKIDKTGNCDSPVSFIEKLLKKKEII